jgi:hypothetical protein
MLDNVTRLNIKIKTQIFHHDNKYFIAKAHKTKKLCYFDINRNIKERKTEWSLRIFYCFLGVFFLLKEHYEEPKNRLQIQNSKNCLFKV